ncbi:MAG: hypothetical protein IPK82_16390 [Polyangiaceae bacterium]|nr:hypothetical protein [Polyangiaceae bacterium]
MKLKILSATLSLVASFALLACGDGTGGGTGGSGGSGGGAPALKWFTTCGDPACGMSTDDPNLADCTTEKDGDPCTTDGAGCEIAGDECNTNLICAASDPKEQQGGCPISLASAKQDIAYLTDADRERIRTDLTTMPLATWKYKREGRGEKEHLGFIIDDQPTSSPAVRPSGERVDLYGYTSMAVAAIQAQDKEIAALKEEIKALRAELRSEKNAPAACIDPSSP